MKQISFKFFKTMLTMAGICVASYVCAQQATSGMVLIKGTKFHYLQQNRWREGLELNQYKEGPLGDTYVEEYDVDLKDFYTDKTEVTNKQYKAFLDATSYKPTFDQNFLKHWKNGMYPKGQENYPVVYIDLDDAKAYAAWAGKQLPTEPNGNMQLRATMEGCFPGATAGIVPLPMWAAAVQRPLAHTQKVPALLLYWI